MENMVEIPAQACAMPRFEDGAINLQELIHRLAEDVANGIMDAEADQMCEATGNSWNGYRTRSLKTCVGERSLRVPKLRSGSGGRRYRSCLGVSHLPYTTALTTKMTSGMVTRKMPMTSMMAPARIIVVMGV